MEILLIENADATNKARASANGDRKCWVACWGPGRTPARI